MACLCWAERAETDYPKLGCGVLSEKETHWLVDQRQCGREFRQQRDMVLTCLHNLHLEGSMVLNLSALTPRDLVSHKKWLYVE